MEILGEGAHFVDNLVEWNGFNGLDGPASVKVGKKNGNVVSHNTLRWNGHVSGLFNGAPKSTFSHNRIERQNWGKLQHDGAGIHVVIAGQNSVFDHNWVFDGDHSMMIRTDTAKSTTLAKVGRHGVIDHNVGWGGPALVVKGDEHRIEHNTVLGPLQVVVNFGKACGMNAKSSVWLNSAFEISHRGSCKGHNSMPANTTGNVAGTNLCEKLRSCALRDFRPKTGAGPLGMKEGVAGAYNPDGPYFLPGRRSAYPSYPIPGDGAKKAPVAEVSLIFMPAKDCAAHTVLLGSDKGDLKSGTKVELKDGLNVVDSPNMEPGKTYYWQAIPDKSCSGASSSPIWSFTTADGSDEPEEGGGGGHGGGGGGDE